MLRAAGDRAFSAGLDMKQAFGQPDDWSGTTRIRASCSARSGRSVWKPVVCAVHGMCTAGAFYFVNEADVVICSDDATFFDSHVSLRHRVRDRADRADAPHRARRHAAHGVDRQRGARSARRPRCGIGLVTEVVEPRRPLGACARDGAACIASYPAAATQGTVRAIWESLDKPYRAAMEQGLMYTRLTNDAGAEEAARRVWIASRRGFDERALGSGWAR